MSHRRECRRKVEEHRMRVAIDPLRVVVRRAAAAGAPGGVLGGGLDRREERAKDRRDARAVVGDEQQQ